MMSEQKIAIQNSETNSHPVHTPCLLTGSQNYGYVNVLVVIPRLNLPVYGVSVVSELEHHRKRTSYHPDWECLVGLL